MYTQLPLLRTAIVAIVLLHFLFCIRILFILPAWRSKPKKRGRNDPARILVVLGSGGHTAEMLAMLAKVDMASFAHRTYVVSSGDAFSAEKARAFEQSVVHAQANARDQQGNGGVDTQSTNDAPIVPSRLRKQRLNQSNSSKEISVQEPNFSIHVLPRARRIHQPLLTTPYTSLQTLFTGLMLLLSQPYPNLIITNGPGTGVIVVLASMILRFFNIRNANSNGSMRTMYIESWARVRKLSLSGRLLIKVVDRFLVQWEKLNGCGGGKGEYIGILI